MVILEAMVNGGSSSRSNRSGYGGSRYKEQ